MGKKDFVFVMPTRSAVCPFCGRTFETMFPRQKCCGAKACKVKQQALARLKARRVREMLKERMSRHDEGTV